MPFPPCRVSCYGSDQRIPWEHWPWWVSHVLQDLVETLPFPMLVFSVRCQSFVLFMALLHSSLCWRASSHPSSSHCTDEPLEVGMYPPGFWTGCKSHGNIYEHLWGCFLRKWHRGAIKPCHISFSCLPRAVDPGEAACEAEFCFQEVKTGKVSKLYSKQLMELFLLLN